MRKTWWEEPQIARLHIGDLRPTLFVEDRDPAHAVRHDGPLGLLVPVHFANAVRRQTHIDAGDIFRDREIFLCDLARPAAILIALVSIVERRPEQRHTVDVGGRRVLERWELIRKRRILRTRVIEARAALAIDPSLGRRIWVAK